MHVRWLIDPQMDRPASGRRGRSGRRCRWLFSILPLSPQPLKVACHADCRIFVCRRSSCRTLRRCILPRRDEPAFGVTPAGQTDRAALRLRFGGDTAPQPPAPARRRAARLSGSVQILSPAVLNLSIPQTPVGFTRVRVQPRSVAQRTRTLPLMRVTPAP